MSDRRPDRVYGILVREDRVFLRAYGERLGLPGGVFRPMAEDRKAELRAHLWDQLGIEANAIWAQGAFDYRNPDEEHEQFSGFYTVWDWQPRAPIAPGRWMASNDVASSPLVPSLRILLLSVLATLAMKTT
ncbi:MAG: hypothetical protein AMXMBFR80_19730 [Dehalococcoidia bacterium]|jgi:hypothetical protein|nr:hypothetical protein [Tepidiformaceae bacterium]